MTQRRLMLIGVNGLLLIGLVLAAIWETSPVIPPTEGGRLLPAPPVQVASVRAVTEPPVSRPLFRAATAPPASSEGPTAVTPPQVRLVGVVLGERRMGYVELNGAKVQSVKEGDDIAGWTVQDIQARHLILSKGDRTATYLLDPPRGS